jgi:hypothetical protein
VTTSLAASDTTVAQVKVIHGASELVLGEFVYSKDLTPLVSDFGPSAGQGGDMIHIVGSKLDGAEVFVGDLPLTTRFGGDMLAQAVVPLLPPGDLPVQVRTANGYACATDTARAMTFQSRIVVQSVVGGKGSMGGGGDVTVVGQGLSGAYVELCESPCHVIAILPEPRSVHAGEDFQALHCKVGAFRHSAEKAALPVEPGVLCDLSVKVPGQTVVSRGAWEFLRTLTPTVRSVSADGVNVTVNGDGFGKAATVTVAQAPCTVTIVRDDYVKCTLPLAGPHEGIVDVVFDGKGAALPTHPEANVLTVTKPAVVPEVVGVAQLEPLNAFTGTLCRAKFTASDCPPGWACCGVQELAEGFGHCAVICAPVQGFLSKAAKMSV